MQLPGFSFLWLTVAVALVPAAAVVRKSTAGAVRQATAGAKSWPMDLGLGSAGDLPLPGQGDSNNGIIDVPGEGQMVDEMVALKQPSIPLALQQDGPRPPKPTMSLVNAGASVETGSMHRSPRPVVASPAAPKMKVVEEYDVQENDDNDDDRTVPMQETKTAEDMDREQRGDVEHVKPEVVKKRKLQIKRLKLAEASQQTEKAEFKQEQAEEQAPGNDKMMGQCMAFAGWVKSQGSTGPDLVRIWKGTCMPSVMAGDAPPAYANMCNALGTTVQKFAVRPWSPGDICQAVLQVFKEAGVGATPLR